MTEVMDTVNSVSNENYDIDSPKINDEDTSIEDAQYAAFKKD